MHILQLSRSVTLFVLVLISGCYVVCGSINMLIDYLIRLLHTK